MKILIKLMRRLLKWIVCVKQSIVDFLRKENKMKILMYLGIALMFMLACSKPVADVVNDVQLNQPTTVIEEVVQPVEVVPAPVLDVVQPVDAVKPVEVVPVVPEKTLDETLNEVDGQTKHVETIVEPVIVSAPKI